ncbi:sulfotransferase [Novosphingobium sp. ZN18A2]|uniref:sulfotransferase family protein n=1 Tax=Novosphingobium sp. ZN18A2 TaxID=3079861 RepID=UPI0030CDEE87
MALEVIGAGLGRTATFTLKFALEHIGFGPCYHMVENFKGARRNVPLWLDAIDGKPDWDAIFEGYRSTTDYPACTYWRELSEYYPDAKVILTQRDPDSWFDSVSETIFSQAMNSRLPESPFGNLMKGAVFGPFNGGDIADRAFMTDWFVRRNREVIDTIAPERLLVFEPKEGWAPLCAFLGVPVPAEPFPRVNSRDELGAASDEKGGLPPDPADLEVFAEGYLAELQAKAFPAS